MTNPTLTSTSTSTTTTITLPHPPFTKLHLSPLDALHPIHYSRRLLIFPCHSLSQFQTQTSLLQTGLESLLGKCPILGGVVAPLPRTSALHLQGLEREDWRTILPGPGLELTIRDLRDRLPSLSSLEQQHFQPCQLPYKDLLPIPPDYGYDANGDKGTEEYAACKVQFSAIEGGSILAWAMSHGVADGIGNDLIFEVLARAVKAAGKGDQTHAGVNDGCGDEQVELEWYDRSPVSNIRSDGTFNIAEHPAYTNPVPPPPAAAPPSSIASPLSLQPHPFTATSPTMPILLQLTPASVARLKADATSPDLSVPRISTHDALAALMWVSVMRIRARRVKSGEVSTSTFTEQHGEEPEEKGTGENEEKGHIYFPSSARKQLHLPKSYLGNRVYQITASLPLSFLLSLPPPLLPTPISPETLQRAALAIRRALLAATPSVVGSYFAELNIPRWIPWAFLERYESTGLAMGSDWGSGGVYDSDWGEMFGGGRVGGGVVSMRYPGEQGLNCIMPRLRDGGAEVVVAVMEGEWEMLRGGECFGPYLDGGGGLGMAWAEG